MKIYGSYIKIFGKNISKKKIYSKFASRIKQFKEMQKKEN